MYNLEKAKGSKGSKIRPGSTKYMRTKEIPGLCRIGAYF